MSTLLDTNLLTRLVNPAQTMHQVALDAVAVLRRRNEPLRIVPQNVYEFWVVATRPVAQNGLGLTPAQTHAEIARFMSWFAILSDGPGILPLWRQLVVQHQVIGKTDTTRVSWPPCWFTASTVCSPSTKPILHATSRSW